MFSLQSMSEEYISFQKGFLHFALALLRDSKFDLMGSKAYGNTSCWWSLNQVDSDPIDLLSQDILIAFQNVFTFGTPKPPSFTVILLVFSSTTLGLFLNMNCFSSLYSDLKCAQLAFGTMMAM